MSKGQKHHCGADSWSKKARKALTLVLKNKGCQRHDKDWSVYEKDPVKAKKLKSDSDKRFLRNQFVWWQPWTWIVAPIAYAAVALGGKKDFKEAQEKALAKTNDAESKENLNV